MSRINWSSAAQGAQVIPVLLIAGMPAIFYPDGVTISGLSISSPDAAWWPGNTYANWTSYAKPWMRLDDGIRFTERAIPAASQVLDVSEITVSLSDVDGGATALFASESSAVGTYITATVTAGAATIPVVSTAAFAASGVIYLDQEAIRYTGKTATSFTGCTRGVFGSKAARHLFVEAQGAGLGNPQCTDLPVESVGRPATLWLCRVVAGVIVDADLQHYGTIGTGPALVGGGESLDDGWILHVDHAVKRAAQTIHAQTISVGGYAHPGNLGARTTGVSPALTGDLTPFWLRIADDATTIPAMALLTGDAASPDLGGWHPTRESFVQSLNDITLSLGGTWVASLSGDGGFSVRFDSSPTHNRFYSMRAPCCERGYASNEGETSAPTFAFDCGQMAEAWVPIMASSPVYVSASDFASVPTAPTSSLASYCLIFGDDDDRASRKVARITGQGSVGGAYYLECSALTTGASVRSSSSTSSGTGSIEGAALWTGGFYGAGFILTTATTARLGLYVSSASWVTALQTIVDSLDTEYACIADAFDWVRIAEVVNAYPTAIPARREYIVDLKTSVLALLQNEAALNGFSLVMHRGRISIARVAEFCGTEVTSDTITTAGLDARAPSPTYEKGADGIINTYTVISPDDGVTVTVTDQTSVAKYGTQGSITAVMPRSLLSTPRDGARLYTQVFAQAVTVLGPLRYPYRHVGIQLPLSHYDLQIGDLASATLWRVPDGNGARGIVDQVVQVVARDVVLYAEGDGHVAYTLRLNPSGIAGYAPAGLVAASGISGATVTLDVASIPTGLSGTGNDAAAFAAGDLVRLVEIDTASPTASTQHTVTAVGTNTLTLSPAPNATFTGLVASALKVSVVYDTWTVLTAGGRTLQERYCFLGQADQTLDATHAARTFAA